MQLTEQQYLKLLSDCKKVAFKFNIKSEEAGDIFHNVYLKVYDKEITSNIEGYFYKAFVNHCLDLVKKSGFKRDRRTNSIDLRFEETYTDELIEKSSSIETSEVIIDTLNDTLLPDVPELDKQMFRLYFILNKSYATIAKDLGYSRDTVIQKVTNLTKYLCYMNTSKMWSKRIDTINNKKIKTVMRNTLRKQEYLKYVDTVTNAQFGYSFNYELFKEASLNMLNKVITDTDKHNREKLKQLAQLLFDELYTVDKETIDEIKPIKDDTTIKKKVVKNTNKK
jgi:RNA polymerase sigma factor (sigma-70 family)